MDRDARARALIELVEADRASRSSDILGPAIAQALVATAIAEERAAYAAMPRPRGAQVV
jgi:hypothetical protein